MNPKVDFYFSKAQQWQQEINALRTIVLNCGLTEELKWGVPCYTFQKSNVVLIHVFKDYCALLFFKGVLLQDANGILVQQSENVQSARQARFTATDQISKLNSVLKAYIYEALEVEKAGLKVDLKKTQAFSVTEELKNKFSQIPDFKRAFEALTPGRQRAYLLHFSAPKQAKTRESRIEKALPRILEGKGLND